MSERLHKALEAKAKTIYELHDHVKVQTLSTVSYPDDYKWIRPKDALEVFSAFQAEQETKWQKLRKLWKERPHPFISVPETRFETTVDMIAKAWLVEFEKNDFLIKEQDSTPKETLKEEKK